MKAIWNNKVIAESNETVEVEGNFYFPESSINREVLKESNHFSLCPRNGKARYFHIQVNGQTNKDAAWVYPAPRHAKEIEGRLAFWKGVEVLDR